MFQFSTSTLEEGISQNSKTNEHKQQGMETVLIWKRRKTALPSASSPRINSTRYNNKEKIETELVTKTKQTDKKEKQFTTK